MIDPEKRRASRERYRLKNLALVAARMRAWRAKNADHYRAWRAARLVMVEARARKKRQAVLGRVCEDCGRSDAEAAWAKNKRRCGACVSRASSNGRCRVCDSIRVRVRSVFGPASKGIRGKPACPDRCEKRPKVSDFTAALWDALRWHDGGEIRLLVLAERMNVTMRTLERRREDLLEILRRFDPDARVDYEKETVGAAAILVFAASKVAQGLERLALGVA